MTEPAAPRRMHPLMARQLEAFEAYGEVKKYNRFIDYAAGAIVIIGALTGPIGAFLLAASTIPVIVYGAVRFKQTENKHGKFLKFKDKKRKQPIDPRLPEGRIVSRREAKFLMHALAYEKYSAENQITRVATPSIPKQAIPNPFQLSAKPVFAEASVAQRAAKIEALLREAKRQNDRRDPTL